MTIFEEADDGRERMGIKQPWNLNKMTSPLTLSHTPTHNLTHSYSHTYIFITWHHVLEFYCKLKNFSVLLALNFTYKAKWWSSSSCAAAAKSLQSCPTLRDPRDGSPPGSPVPGTLQARTLEWVAISSSNAWKWSRSVVSDSQRPHGPQPTRLLRPWDSLGKGTGVGCHCLLCQVLVDRLKFPVSQPLRLLPTTAFSPGPMSADCVHKWREKFLHSK